MVRAQANQGQDKITTLTVDFSNTDDRKGGRSAHVPPGDYLLEVTDAEVVSVKSDPSGKKKQVAWIFRIKGGEAGIGQIVYYYTSLDETKRGGLWQLRNLLSDLAGGTEIAKSKANIDLTSKIGKQVGATLVDDEPYMPTDESGSPKLNPDGSQVVIEKSVISLTFPASSFVGIAAHAAQTQPVPQVPAQAAAPAPAAVVQNGAVADPVAVAAAIAQPAVEDADIEPLPVADL